MATLSESTIPLAVSERDPYRPAVMVLAAAAGLGAVAAIVAGVDLGHPILLDLAVSLSIATGILVEVAIVQSTRSRAVTWDDVASALVHADAGAPSTEAHTFEDAEPPSATARVASIASQLSQWLKRVFISDALGRRTAMLGLAATWLVMFFDRVLVIPTWQTAAMDAGGCLAAAALAAVATRYLTQIDGQGFPEARALAQGARVIAWLFVLAAASIGLARGDWITALRVLHAVCLALNVAVCFQLLSMKRPAGLRGGLPLDLGVISLLGNRPNILASVLDAAERQLGIDLRSTWALTIVRRSIEPLVVGLGALAWLATALTVVGPEEQAVVERLGVPVQADVLPPGLHLHWPWPIDRVFRIPVRRVQVLTVGHEGEEAGGPEDVLWARQHAANEYTLLLGDGRDLITVDASVQFQITDARAWRYHTQNPADALRAIAYRAVMRNTVSKTLADALSENVVSLTQRMHAEVQQEADALGLGVQVLGFTVGGMHPPVDVAGDYQAVVSAALRKVTVVVDAEGYRNGVVPRAESTALGVSNRARADGAKDMARATGEASSFLVLQSQYGADPKDFLFRRRLETFEKDFTGRNFTIVDSRIQRDGGELWVTP